MTTKTRFAPSPTGHLHIGNIRTALHNWMWAQKTGGQFILRIDDTDKERSKEEYVAGIRSDLAWLGLNSDAEFRQSERFDLYDAAFDRLKAQGRVYPCYETAQELDLRRKILRGQGRPPIYERTALALSEQEIAAYEAAGRTPHWRFKLDHDAPIAWDDAVRGPQRFDPAAMSDPVIRRGDGSWLYMLPSAVDDAAMGITHVVRGEDHVSNTAAQIQMFVALGAAIPKFAHSALLVGKEGKLSKRLGSLGVASFQDRHIVPQAIIALLARLGTSEPVVAEPDTAHLVKTLDFARFGRAPAKFDEAELERLNTALVHQMDYAAVAEHLPDGMDAAAWHAIRPNVAHLGEVEGWWKLVTGPIAACDLEQSDKDYLATACATLSTLDWGQDIWPRLTAALKDKTGRKGKALFLPLRRGLTGENHGPDMSELLPLIGRDAALDRLKIAAQ